MKVFVVDLQAEEVDGPSNFHINAFETVFEVKSRLSQLFNINLKEIKVENAIGKW